MRALRYRRYGSPDALAFEELPEPVPGAGHAKVRVRAVGLNPLDWKLLAGHLRLIPLLPGPPRGLGFDFAGEIVGVGGGATERHVGERVFGSLTPFVRDGACCEFISVPYERMLPLPAEIDDAHAAALPIAGGTALQALTDDAHVVHGQRVLVTGAAGGVGHFAVQIAKHLGAYVVGVCSAPNADLARNLGADEVLDYASHDFTRRDDRFDVVFDAACASNFSASRRVLTESGIYLNTGGDAASVVKTATSAVLSRLGSRQRAIPVALRNGPPIWRRLLDLARKGAVRAHIRESITLENVPDALRAMETGHGRGKIVVVIA